MLNAMVDAVDIAPISNQEFDQFRSLIHRIAGISLSPAKKTLVSGRLIKRLRHHRLSRFGEYFRLITRHEGSDELQVAVDMLTTNETHFYREPKHFDFLRERVLPMHPSGRTLRIWSAACSSGEEPYSLAMLLTEQMGNRPWEILGSDISTRMLDKARAGLYELHNARGVTSAMLRNHCLKGVGSREGQFLVDPAVRNRVSFAQINLNEPLPDVGEFDVIFLRNVMIYFQTDTKQQVVSRLLSKLRRGGWFFIGHSESLNGLTQGLETLAPAVYRKP